MSDKKLLKKELEEIQQTNEKDNKNKKELFWTKVYKSARLHIFFTRTSKDKTTIVEQLKAVYNSPNLIDVKHTLHYLVQIGSILIPDMENHPNHLGDIYISKKKYLSIWDLTDEKWKS